ncbi:MAG: isoprenylcysteine carboxylmethyltransferase family protein, partial [Alphaproteobacteria bacterium]
VDGIPNPWNWLGIILCVAGVGLSGIHARLFFHLGTNIYTFGEPGQMTTEAFYSRTRNPMYLGLLVTLIGLAVVFGTVSPLVGPLVFFALANFWYIPWEERAMATKFGEAYAESQKSVRRWL